MPLEIREIVIRANIQRKDKQKEQLLSPQKIQHLKKEIAAYCLEKIEDKIKQNLES